MGLTKNWNCCEIKITFGAGIKVGTLKIKNFRPGEGGVRFSFFHLSSLLQTPSTIHTLHPTPYTNDDTTSAPCQWCAAVRMCRPTGT